MTAAEVVDFETQHSVSLPEQHRAFLLLVGNGAPGPPAYGLRTLPDPAAGSDFPFGAETLAKMRFVFPFTKTWVWEDGEVSDEGTDDHIHNGQLYLGTDGCAMDWFLIITGPERGNVWMNGDIGMSPTSPKRDFLQWVEDWLDGVDNWWVP